ncbi:GNAT family N-acetyltransferase [Marmoricola sp. URHB0036]|uniref:GNAT family N-acetyltransferase n=1 Tax=Marmoricola sp. URHB0036 TaxID=1298863 RepID=UPI000400828A|nr:GNAT family N-acetyltransferase [Marmoricola sp. URHB0036]
MTALTLEPFLVEHLPLVQPWFENDEVRHRLGGPDWPVRSLTVAELDDDEFRGMRVLRSHTWLARLAGTPVGYLGGEVYDRWTVWDGQRVTAWEPGPAMGTAYVVAPDRWRQGIGSALLLAWVETLEVEDVDVFVLGIDHDNVASRRCAESAGFRAEVDVPDWEEIVYFTRRRERP